VWNFINDMDLLKTIISELNSALATPPAPQSEEMEMQPMGNSKNVDQNASTLQDPVQESSQEPTATLDPQAPPFNPQKSDYYNMKYPNFVKSGVTGEGSNLAPASNPSKTGGLGQNISQHFDNLNRDNRASPNIPSRDNQSTLGGLGEALEPLTPVLDSLGQFLQTPGVGQGLGNVVSSLSRAISDPIQKQQQLDQDRYFFDTSNKQAQQHGYINAASLANQRGPQMGSLISARRGGGLENFSA
jgi:hypothetical protein